MTNLQDLRAKNLSRTIALVKDSVKEDSLIIQTIRSIDDTTKVINTLAKRLRDWYALYNPEFEDACEDHEAFIRTILEKPKPVLLKELKVSETMGADLGETDIQAIMTMAQSCHDIIQTKSQQEAYLENLMKRATPNLQAVAGTAIGARLIEIAGSLRRLATLPASTVQLLGAEQALFRHLVSKAKCPKHGILIMHPLVAKAKRKGKAARVVADKAAIAARIDFFKGEFQGDILKQQMEAKLCD